MSELIDNTRFLNTLQQRILTNLQEGRPAHDGLDREQLKRGVQILRADRTRATTEKAKNTRKSKAAPTVDLKTLVESFEIPGEEG